MKPTMVVSPGQPPPGMQQFQSFGTPPPAAPMAPMPPPKKSRVGLYIGIGCGGCLLIVTAIIAIAALIVLKGRPGTEISSAPVAPNVPFTVIYTQTDDAQRDVWMELDVSYSQGLRLTGPINISVNNQVVGQYNLEMTGSGSPIRERNTSKNWDWVSTNLNGIGSTSGKTFLFPLPAYDNGATISLTGTIAADPTVVVRQMRIFVTD